VEKVTRDWNSESGRERVGREGKEASAFPIENLPPIMHDSMAK